MSTTLALFDPRFSIYLGGFDRRGCSASIHNATATGFIVSGIFSDLADFVTIYLFDTDDFFGHLYSSKYLPIQDLTGVILEFDVSSTNCYYPKSYKNPSVPWNALSWVKADGTKENPSSPTLLPLTAITGGVAASVTLTIGGTPVAFNRLQIIFIGNIVFEYILDATDTISDVINSITQNTNLYYGLVKQINDLNALDPIAYPFTATGTSTDVIITSTSESIDGNSIQFFTQYKQNGGAPADTTISPANAKMTGGIDPTSYHVTIDFATIDPLTSIELLKQCWLTIAPNQQYDSSGSAQTGQTFSKVNFSYEISNISITDPGTLTGLKMADPSKSVVVDSRDVWAIFSGSWNQEAGFYHYGFSKASSAIDDTVVITYSCQYTHDLYLGTALYSDRGKFGVELDGSPLSDLDCYFPVASQIVTRRQITTGVTAGKHKLVLTVKAKNGASSGNVVYFDYLQACVEGDPQDPTTTYPNISAAFDYDTDQTYKISPARSLFLLSQTGFQGGLDVYAGVFFALIRRRRGGNFHSAVLTVSGTLNPGTGFGDGDAFFITIGTTTFGVAAYPADSLDSIAQRFVNAINSLFVGVWASKTGTGELTITVLSPINGFFLSITSTTLSGATFTKTGDIGILNNESVYIGGTEGIWEVDPTQTSPLNKAFTDFISDFDSVMTGAGLTLTIAFSQELLAPPDDNTSAGAWIQRFADSSTVLTSTGFGFWGFCYVEAVSGSGTITIKATGHGFISGYVISINNSGAYTITVIDVDHFSLVGAANVDDVIRVQLQTSQVNFNPATVTTYIGNCYLQLAGLLSAPYLQFGEVGWWFFPGLSPTDTRGMAFYDAYTADAANTALGRALASFVSPNDDPSINSHADANFLQSQIETHIHTIAQLVLGSFAGAKFSMLWPNDVNWQPYYNTSPMSLPPIGGQLNYYINIPGDYKQGAGISDLNRLDVEALAWGTTYRTLDNAKVSMSLSVEQTPEWGWGFSDIRYFIPWQNGGCPWQAEYLQTTQFVDLVNLIFWAFDHLILFSWKLPLPEQLVGIE